MEPSSPQPVFPPQQRPPESKGFMQKIGGWILGIGLGIWKLKFLILPALKTSLSMILMIVVYTVFFGWKFAVGIVLMIFIHEMGHVLASWWFGLRVTALMFVPFFGAYTGMERAGHSWIDAKISYAGPLAGAIAAWACFFLAQHQQSDWLMALASVSFLINLFNMIPVPPLDGGYICAAISRWFWFLGMILLGFALFYFQSWITATIIIVMVCFITLPQIQQTFFGEQTEEMKEYYSAHLSNRLIMAVLYLALLGFLVVGYEVSTGLIRFDWNDHSISTLGGWLDSE